MLEKPELQDELINDCLQAEYGLEINLIEFLPLGADLNTAVYRAVAAGGSPYFVKLRSGPFNSIVVTLPKYLSDQGLQNIIPPLMTRSGRLWAELGAFKLILYPFVEGRDGYETRLATPHWRQLGRALQRVHNTALPPALAEQIPSERYAPGWRAAARKFLARLDNKRYSEPVAIEMAAFLLSKREQVLDLVARAERLAEALQARSPQFVLCHADIHAGNVHIDGHDHLYLVDWDDPILAPKERDLMFIGGGLFGNWQSSQEEEAQFYGEAHNPGYGPAQIDPLALAYYRYERIIIDIAVYCQQIFLSDEGGEDREQALHYLKSNFLAGHTIEIAYHSDQSLIKY